MTQYIYHNHNYIVVVNGYYYFTLGMGKGIEFIYIRFMAQIWVDCTIKNLGKNMIVYL